MAENDYTPTQITLPNGIVGRVNNPDDPVALEFMRVFQEVAKSFPVSEKTPKPADESHGYTRFEMYRAYNTLYTVYGLATHEEVMAEKRFVHLVFADGMKLDYFPSLEHWRISPEKEMVDFVMQYRHLPFDELDGE